MNPSEPILLIFTKNPEKGKVKTRLARDVGDDRALEIYKQLLDHTHSVTVDLDCEKHLYYSNHIGRGDIWDLGNYQKFVQQGQDLGDKMSNAFKNAFKEHHGSVCIIGSDCLEINESIIQEAFLKLEQFDFVVGPARDGGYYLLGMKSYFPQLFYNKTYSTPEVFEELVMEIKRLDKSFFLLPKLSDVDTLDDLKL